MSCLRGVAVLALLLVPWGARAEPQPLWGTVRLPGSTIAARRVLGLDTSAGRDSAGTLLDIIRFARDNNTTNQNADRLRRYLEFIEEFQVERSAFPLGLTLPVGATPKETREATKALSELLGLRLRERRGTYSFEVDTSSSSRERSGWLALNGIDTSQVAATANRVGSAPLDLSDDELPLPLPAFWKQEVFEPRHLPVLDITNDRKWSLAYVGLMALDDETLSFLSARSPLVRQLRDDHPGAFAAFGRSVRVRDGAVDSPGGPDADGVWQNLVGRAPSDAERFIHDLFNADDGRLAYFYDVVSHLDPWRQSFVLGGYLQGGDRIRFVQGVYATFPSTAGWNVDDRPFFRPVFDAGLAVSFVESADGRVCGPPWWPSVLKRVSDDHDWSATPERVERDIEERPADAAWTLEWMFQSPKEAATRFAVLRLAQRLFPSVQRDAALPFEQSLRAVTEMPTLARTLERMGVDDPVVFAKVAGAARTLTKSGGVNDAGLVLARWQAILGLLEQRERLRALPRDLRDRLLVSLAEATPSSADAHGVLAGWFVEQFLPAFLEQTVDDAMLEAAAIDAFAGAGARQSDPVTWEGLEYVLDRPGVVARQSVAVRQSQRLPRLGDMAALQRITRVLEDGVPRLADLEQIVAEMRRLQPALETLPTINKKPPAIVKNFRDAAVRLGKIKSVQDLKRAGREASVVTRALEAVADNVLIPLLYALAGTPTDQPSQVIATAWIGHTFLPASLEDVRSWSVIAWLPATAEPALRGGLIFRGSYLNLDLALAESRLPVVAPDDVGAARTTEEDHRAIVEALDASAPPGAPIDDGSDIVSAVRNGRALVEQWASEPPSRASLHTQLRAAGVDEWRTNLLIWRLERNAANAPAALRVTEVYHLGGGRRLSRQWGWPASMIDGCLCLLAPEGRTPEDVRGRSGTQASAIEPDLLLRIVEHLAVLKLPPWIAPLLVPRMTAEWLNHIQQAGAYDWQALAAWPTLIRQDQVEEALLRLVALGVLAPPRGAAGGDRR